jgi:glycosyltransferase involved in cell wall biosynthesis
MTGALNIIEAKRVLGDPRLTSRDELRVMFDPQIFCHQRFGGISRYICNIALEMIRIPGVSPIVVAPYHFNEHLDTLPKSIVKGRRIRWLEGLTALAYGASVLPGKMTARSMAPQILHSTYYFPISPPAASHGILTVYDMIHERYPSYFAASPFITRIKAASVRAAEHVICISESTRRDVLETYDISEERVSVTHLGFDPLASLLTSEPSSAFRLRVLGADAPYLLYVGSRAIYKNFLGLLDAYAASPWLRNNFFLLCFGGGPFTRSERKAISAAGLETRVKQLSGADAVLASCYSHASLYVCPSLCEGFGIPLLESMSLDCPVACSNVSSLPEVAGDAARLFDPADRDSIRGALEAVLSSTSAGLALKERGRNRLHQFSWRACAENTVRIYRKVAGHA